MATALKDHSLSDEDEAPSSPVTRARCILVHSHSGEGQSTTSWGHQENLKEGVAFDVS